MSKVSIIVPVYGVEAYLEECIDTLLAQTYKSIELILVDDATGKMNDTTTFAVTGYYNSEYDVFNVSEGKANLAGIFNNTKGTMIGDDGVGGLFNETDSEIQIFKYDIDTPIAILALILFVLDIIFRNIVVIKKKDANQMTEEERMASMRGR